MLSSPVVIHVVSKYVNYSGNFFWQYLPKAKKVTIVLHSSFFSFFSDRDTEREQKLYSAAANGNVNVVKDLLKSTFVDPTPPENLHFTPLMKAGKSLCNLLFSESFYHFF